MGSGIGANRTGPRLPPTRGSSFARMTDRGARGAEPHALWRNFTGPALFLLATLLYGTVGYSILTPRANLIDGLYWTVLTLGGVGHSDTLGFSAGFELFSISLIVLLVISITLFVAVGTRVVASGDVAKSMGRLRMNRAIEGLDGHVIVCGYGRVGRACVKDLLQRGRSVAVVDVDPRHEAALNDLGVAYLISEPDHESVLRRLRVDRASAVICAVDSDAINVYITLAARDLRQDITVVARASDPDSIHVLERAGADSVISPYTVSGSQMAELAAGAA